MYSCGQKFTYTCKEHVLDFITFSEDYYKFIFDFCFVTKPAFTPSTLPYLVPST